MILSPKRFGRSHARDATVKGDDYFLFLLIHLEEVGKGIISGPMPMGQRGSAPSDMSKPKMDWDTIWMKSKIDDWVGRRVAIPFRSILLMLNRHMAD